MVIVREPTKSGGFRVTARTIDAKRQVFLLRQSAPSETIQGADVTASRRYRPMADSPNLQSEIKVRHTPGGIACF